MNKGRIKRIKRKIQQKLAYQKWRKFHFLSAEAMEAQRKYMFDYEPKISVVVPLFKTPEPYLEDLIESVRMQTYGNWELCLSDGSGEHSPLKAILEKYQAIDTRIKVIHNNHPLHISENTNEALKRANGDFIAFVDHDDLLEPDAFYECVRALNADNNIDIIYTDEDKIDMKGKTYFMPHFKTDYNPDMLRSVNYFCHLCLVRRTICEKAGLLDQEYEGAQDYDYILRCTEITENIKHIPKVLYHWRAHRESTAENPESKDYAFEAGKRAIQAHLNRKGLDATVEKTDLKGVYRVKYRMQDIPLLSVVILDEGCPQSLEQCIVAIEKKSTYKNYEILIVRDCNARRSNNEYEQKIMQVYSNIKIIDCRLENANNARKRNYAIKRCNGQYVLFIDYDAEIINEDCFDELLGCAMREGTGVVGSRVYRTDGTVQHAGMLIGKNGAAGPAFRGAKHHEPGYFGRIITMQNYCAVSSECMLVRKSIFEEVGGFEENYLCVLEDVDFCMKVKEAGYLNVYNPYAEVKHIHKGKDCLCVKSKKAIVHDKELFVKRWERVLEQGDPYYNPNLHLYKEDFDIKP